MKELFRVHFKEKETGLGIYTNVRATSVSAAIAEVKELYNVDVITKVKTHINCAWVIIDATDWEQTKCKQN